MATLNESSLQMRLEKRKGTISEVERPQFEKQQAECIVKAIKNEECPAKEKHVRRSIIGTWQERGNSMFWSIIGKQPLPSQAVMCWKALTVLHKVLREGHPNVLKDSYVYRKTFRDLLSVYKFQGGIYSSLVLDYLKVLQSKVDLHHKYPGIPGGLTSTAENPVKIPGRDINDVFTFGVETLDYQDLLLNTEESILQTLDKSKNNSNIASSQCKIAPLVPIIKECSGMYDVLVQVLTRLHKNLPPDTLDGLRQRFYEQHKKLKTFCMHAATMHYITSLTAIPVIPDTPPDFLIHKYQPKQKREEPKDEPLPAPIAPQVDERDVLIEQLMMEISELREHLDVTISQGKQMEDHLRMEILRQKEELMRMEEITKQVCQENSLLKEQVEAMKEYENAGEKAKDADDKFNKLKLLYGKLRQEHIDLLRKNAEIKQKEENAGKLVTELQETVEQIKLELAEREKELLDLKEISASNENNSEVQDLQDQIALLNEKLNASEDKVGILNQEIEAMKESANEQVKSLSDQLDSITTGKITEESARKNAEDTISKLRSDNEEIRNNLELSLAEMKQLMEDERVKREAAENSILCLTEEMNTEVSRLKEDIDNITKLKEELEEEKTKLEQDWSSKEAEMGAEILNLSEALQKSQQDYLEETEKRKKLELELDQLRKEFESKMLALSSDLEQIKAEKQEEENARKEIEIELSELKAKNTELEEERERRRCEDALNMRHNMLSVTAGECEKIIQSALDLFGDQKHETGTTCSAEFLQSRLEGLVGNIQTTTSAYSLFCDTKEDVFPVIGSLNSTCHRLSDALIHGKATSHMTSTEDCNNLVMLCKSIGGAALSYLHDFKEIADPGITNEHSTGLELEIEKLVKFVEELVPKQSDSSDNVQNIVEEEMLATEKIVEDAASKIEEILGKSRQTHSGVQLEVNEKILESCTALMNAIRELILKSKDLQDEIVAEGRGSASVTEYYKRHNKWAEGLLSAAKSVGWGASVLVDAADKVIEGKGKFEELIVASHEISASTVQLVAASRVKASNNSKRLPPLMKASKNVGHATADVVAAVRSGATLTEDSKTMPDYSKMTLTQAKRWEMDSQVKMLELEDLLNKERSNLGELRKAHYRIAVELYGEDQVNMDV